jgi:hypothetical protein
MYLQLFMLTLLLKIDLQEGPKLQKNGDGLLHSSSLPA